MQRDFRTWIIRLNVEAIAFGMAPGLTDTTGEDVWREEFDAGLSPIEAILKDIKTYRMHDDQ